METIQGYLFAKSSSEGSLGRFVVVLLVGAVFCFLRGEPFEVHAGDLF